ncbi:spermidine/putrescine ABC transporter ATP-binding component [Mesoplasma florum L1]|uniref:Spermidine/putrescine import ATP-binding protein PotA n=1 Tax=Mesoplasma florum (strain ATCC 33453 / NBRC 100688 / NCTC 11704 / L1) TaxID=265311 RepID=POTA_MESFL|nr:spermidine/putrescine ABC transporter ATP-binding protein [Mesoplasma florum]Q6F0V4.1 RecName: Full=Spermidine/putrescine import ATP-binding protein PotA [Mesoplasma florum L1]AAT75869.1 spermidine/putrescine ABC transporter ATP-binding component [Mesoplasma florum L1]ATI73477.1 spermidine/putrescine ABC transporter ATP-binding protein [Mesoplasma florum]ATI74162.1 spermidine/putrescine ABC transporter ATP-binding protein [Mesoplasma florum]AVN61175.1 spermidine/putrescine ABC transporter A
MENNILELRNVTKDYDGKVVLKGIDLNIKEGEFITLLGPSGCGKTTTLRIVAGFEKPNSGQIMFEGKDLLPIPINKRQFNTIFQSYALFPHLNVFDNIAFGLRTKKTKKDILQREVLKQIRQVGLEGFEDRNINDLSGGQKQRVAIARALVMKPKVLLLDEPLAALDVQLRQHMREELKRLQREIGITFLMVSHDQEEALSISDRVVVMNEGSIQQIGTPEDIYNEPENLWVAKFIGQSNIIEDGIFIEDNKVQIDGKTFVCDDTNFGENEKSIDIVIRPEDIEIKKTNAGFFNGTVMHTTFKGVHWELLVETTKKRIWKIHTTQAFKVDDKVSIKWNDEAIHVMWKEVE